MNINLSETEIQTVLSALDTWMEQPSEWEGEEWLRRQDAGADLSAKLRRAVETSKLFADRLMSGTADPCSEPEALCANDPIKW